MVDSLQSTGTFARVSSAIFEPFGQGLIRDVKKKIPVYLSEYKDGLNIKTASSVFFLFFACLAPAVAFGGLLEQITNGLMGTTETIGATAIGGTLYAIFSGQPLTIIGTTGPLLAFIEVLYSTCENNGVPFLPVYSWIGLWSSLFLALSSLFSTSNLIQYFTKFTDEIFSMLISLIFITEAVRELAKGFINPAVTGAQACFSLVIATSTYFIASTLSDIRKSNFLPRKLRSIVADFAPTLGVLSGIALTALASARYALKLPRLAVPHVFSTSSGRPWFVDIFSLPHHLKLLCVLPALMATVLLYMDQNITTRLVIAKKNHLKKGFGVHLDMVSDYNFDTLV